jgi:adenine phosphoribosyltransferase|tara:strand:+ start:796 stop:1314 length:519 start_codon:yes stop_codon:yes gene_type:complete
MIKQYIKSYIDFPVTGVNYKDTASLCASADGFEMTNHQFYSSLLKYMPCDKIVGIDARGFPFAAVFAHRTRHPLVLARKAGKLPGPTVGKEFELEYGTATLEIQADVIDRGDRVVVFDDLMATGGTMNATIDIIEEMGATVIAVACVMDLTYLPGAQIVRDRNIPFYSVVEY